MYGWLVSAFIRVATGSATVAITTASGLLIPVMTAHPELDQTHKALIVVVVLVHGGPISSGSSVVGRLYADKE